MKVIEQYKENKNINNTIWMYFHYSMA
jgi:hypothetical protein